MSTLSKKPCEYCGQDLPRGVDLRTRRIRSRHFAHCETRLAQRDANLAKVQSALEQLPSLETVYETIIEWDEGGGKRSRRELARRIVALYSGND